MPVRLCAIYGFRRSEVLGLKWKNVDFINRTITISETLQQHTGGNYTDHPKTESSYRTLPLNNTAYDLLKEQKKLQDERKLLMGNYYIYNDYVCTWGNGEVIAPNYLTRTFHSVIQNSTLPQIRLHDLRHSVASNLLNLGFSVVQVQEWLGHGSASTTLNFYAHVDKSSKISIADTLDKLNSEQEKKEDKVLEKIIFRKEKSRNPCVSTVSGFEWQGQKDLNPRHAVLEFIWRFDFWYLLLLFSVIQFAHLFIMNNNPPIFHQKHFSCAEILHKC